MRTTRFTARFALVLCFGLAVSTVRAQIVSTLAGSGALGATDAAGAAASFNNPLGICSDAVGNLYIADWSNNRIRKITPAGGVSTFAGSGAIGATDAIGTAARFYGPSGICADSAGNLYVADTGNHRIRKITPSGVVSTLAGSGAIGGTDGTGTTVRFNSPLGVCWDATTGNLYVADTGNQRIRTITPVGAVTTLAGSGTAGFADGAGTAASFKGPSGICADTAGNLYVADTGNHRIRKITPAGVVSTFAGSGIQGETNGYYAGASFNTPMGVCWDAAAGTLYVADMYNQRIRMIIPAGEVTTLAGSGAMGATDGTGATARFLAPRGICVDAARNLYVTDTGNQKIRKVSLPGVVTTLAGTGQRAYQDGAGTAACFFWPMGICADSAGNLYVADLNNSRIRKITPAGVVSTFAGSGAIGVTDGPGTTASFFGPRGVCIDAAGNLYVAEQDRIRKITPAGVVSTIAGSRATGAQSAGYVDDIGTAARFNSPEGVCIDAAGTLYVADTNNHRIRKITSAAVVTTLAGSGTATFADGIGTAASFNKPTGICVDPAGNLYVADMMNNRIRKITPAGVVTTLVGAGVVAGVAAPTGICIDAAGNLYVADFGTNRIRKITPAGVVTTLAGILPTGFQPYGSRDGIVTAASFNQPQGVCIDARGNVYVADANNQKIRKIVP